VALLYHPDKCTAPGADEAFKAIGHAFAVLGDKEKRASYDMFGSESASPGMGRRSAHPFAHGFHPNSNFAQFEADISPEELFNMFFGANTRGRLIIMIN
jgi:DnaJ family protein B protein 12